MKVLILEAVAPAKHPDEIFTKKKPKRIVGDSRERKLLSKLQKARAKVFDKDSKVASSAEKRISRAKSALAPYNKGRANKLAGKANDALLRRTESLLEAVDKASQYSRLARLLRAVRGKQ